MSQENMLVILNEQFENADTKEKVEGITIMIDGKFKKVLDIMLEQHEDCNSYAEIIQKILFKGIEEMMKEQLLQVKLDLDMQAKRYDMKR